MIISINDKFACNFMKLTLNRRKLSVNISTCWNFTFQQYRDFCKTASYRPVCVVGAGAVLPGGVVGAAGAAVQEQTALQRGAQAVHGPQTQAGIIDLKDIHF